MGNDKLELVIDWSPVSLVDPDEPDTTDTCSRCGGDLHYVDGRWECVCG